MDYREEITELRNFLLSRAKQSREEKETAIISFERGLNSGYAVAYELCAKWLTEILEGAE